MADLAHSKEQPTFEQIRLTPADIEIRKIRLDDLWCALREGYDDFGAKPGAAVPLLIMYYVLFAAFFTWFAMGGEIRYLIFPIVAGFTLFGPMVGVVFFEFSRLRESGLPLRWGSTFRFIHTHSLAPLLALSIIMTLLYLSWLYLAEVIYFGTVGQYQPATVAEFIEVLFSTRSGGALIAYGNFVGFLFAFTAMAISIVSFALALDKPVTTVTAISTSIRAFITNFWVLAVWGIVVVVMLTIGAALFFIGLAIALPILGHATWHLYEKIVESSVGYTGSEQQ